MTETTKSWIFRNRPQGKLTSEVFELQEGPVPDPKSGEVLVKACYVSVDPYMRNRMNNIPSYIAPFKTGLPLEGDVVGKVVESNTSRFRKGTMVTGMCPWSEYFVVREDSVIPIEDTGEAVHWLGVLGLTGLTAYFGMLDIGQPKAGETVVVSGAAGAVGSIAGQIAKLLGARVVGITGSDQKADYLTGILGFDAALNYKSEKNLRKALFHLCPDGIDVYFDNVGGDISDAVLYRINDFARIVLCGQISQYNNNRIIMGPRLNALLLVHRALMQGFIVYDYRNRFDEARRKIREWMNTGKMMAPIQMIEGFEKLPEALLGLFEGINTGKMIVKV